MTSRARVLERERENLSLVKQTKPCLVCDAACVQHTKLNTSCSGRGGLPLNPEWIKEITHP